MACRKGGRLGMDPVCWHMTIFVFLYKVLDSTPWNFRNFIEDYNPFLMIPIGCFSNIFRRRFKFFLGTWLRFPRELAWRSLPNLPGGIGSCCWVACSSNRAVLSESSWDCSLSLSSLWRRVSNVLGGNNSPLQAMYWELFSLTSAFCHSLMEELLRGCIPFSP